MEDVAREKGQTKSKSKSKPKPNVKANANPKSKAKLQSQAQTRAKDAAPYDEERDEQAANDKDAREGLVEREEKAGTFSPTFGVSELPYGPKGQVEPIQEEENEEVWPEDDIHPPHNLNPKPSYERELEYFERAEEQLREAENPKPDFRKTDNSMISMDPELYGVSEQVPGTC